MARVIARILQEIGTDGVDTQRGQASVCQQLARPRKVEASADHGTHSDFQERSKAQELNQADSYNIGKSRLAMYNVGT